MTRLKQRLHNEAASCIGKVFLLRSMMIVGYSELNNKLLKAIWEEQIRYDGIMIELDKADVEINIDFEDLNDN